MEEERNENLEAAPVEDKAAEAEPLPSEVAVEPTVPELPDKYKGKPLEEIVKMHMNAEKKISELGMKVNDLSAQLLTVPVVPEEENTISKADDPFAATENELKTLKKQNQTLAIGMSVMMARQDKDLPEWNRYETEILTTVKSKPYLLSDPTWTKTAYNLVMSSKLPEIIAEAEQRGKQKMTEEKPKAPTEVVDASRQAPPPVPPKGIRERLIERRLEGRSIDDMLMDDALLTPAERALLK